MKIREITLKGKNDPLSQEHVEVAQIPMFRASAQRKLNQTGFPDVFVDFDDVQSVTQAGREIFRVQVSLTRKTETEKFEVLFVSDSPLLNITYSGLCSIYEIEDFQPGVQPSEPICAAIGVMADILFGHLACRV